jgi:hypothetical protein
MRGLLRTNLEGMMKLHYVPTHAGHEMGIQPLELRKASPPINSPICVKTFLARKSLKPVLLKVSATKYFLLKTTLY